MHAHISSSVCGHMYEGSVTCCATHYLEEAQLHVKSLFQDMRKAASSEWFQRMF